MSTIIDLAPIPQDGAQVLTYRLAIVLSEGIEISYRLKLGARIAELIQQAAMEGVFIDAILPEDNQVMTCQIAVDLGYGGQVPPRLPGNHTKEV